MVARARFAQCPRLALTTPRGSRSLGEKYHDNCGCTVAEVFDDWEPSYAERQQKALYEEARKACKKKGLEPNTKNVLAQMRELGDGTVHDAHVPEGERRKPGRKPKTQTGGSGGGGGKKPPRPLMGFGGNDDPKRHMHIYESTLGSRGEVTPPTVKDLVSYLAPAEDKLAEFSPDERQTAQWLRSTLGIHLWSLRRRTGVGEVTPDSLLEDLGGSMELKFASTENALVSQVRKGRKQSPRITVWSGLNDLASVQRGINSALSKYGDQVDELIVIFNNGSEYVYWKHD